MHDRVGHFVHYMYRLSGHSAFICVATLYQKLCTTTVYKHSHHRSIEGAAVLQIYILDLYTFCAWRIHVVYAQVWLQRGLITRQSSGDTLLDICTTIGQ